MKTINYNFDYTRPILGSLCGRIFSKPCCEKVRKLLYVENEATRLEIQDYIMEDIIYHDYDIDYVNNLHYEIIESEMK